MGYWAETGGRFVDDERWTMQLAALLGNDYAVCEGGLSGRTTVFDDPLYKGLCGMHHLSAALGLHNPIDVLMLGTNNCKQRFFASAKDIADSVERLARWRYGAEHRAFARDSAHGKLRIS